MMKQLLIVTVISAFAFLSCKSKSTDTGEAPANASQYYEKIIELEESMSEALLTTEAAIKARGDKKDFEGIARSAREMEDSVDLRINALKKMEPLGKGGDDFQLVATRYYEDSKRIHETDKQVSE